MQTSSHIEVKQHDRRFSKLNPEFGETSCEAAKARKLKIEALLYLYDKLLIDHYEIYNRFQIQP